jgi:acetolactate synthase-1/2/3 large subunit
MRLDPHALLKEADFVLVVDCDLPWIPKEGGPRRESESGAYRSRPLVRPLSRCVASHRHRDSTGVASTLEALWAQRAESRRPRTKAFEESRKSVTMLSSEVRSKAGAAWRHMADGNHRQVASRRALNKLLDSEHDPRSNEIPTVLEEMTIKSSRACYFGNTSSRRPGLGLARRSARSSLADKTVICALGDGAYMFGNPTAGTTSRRR